MTGGLSPRELRAKKLRLERALGLRLPPVRSSVVAEHLAVLRGAGVPDREVARLAGVSGATVAAIRLGRTSVTQSGVAGRLLGVTLEQVMSRPGQQFDRLPAAGTFRRIQALQRLGHSHEVISAASGVPGFSSAEVIRARDTRPTPRVWVFRESYEAACRAYDALWDVPGASSRVAAAAARRGWVPPLAWDDDTIDDPAATPHGTTRASGAPSAQCDDAVVARALAGTPQATTEQERAVLVPELAARGLSDHQIAVLCRVSSRTVLRTRRGAHVPTRWRTAA